MKKGTIIIIDGQENSGKEELVNNILNHYTEMNFKYILCKDNTYKECCEVLNEIEESDNYIIHDFYLGKIDLSKRDIRHIEGRLIVLNNSFNIIPIVSLTDEKLKSFISSIKSSNLNWFLHDINGHDMWDNEYLKELIENGNRFLIKG